MSAVTTDLSPDVSAPTATSRPLALLLAVGGLIGLVASFVLTRDKLELLADPDFVPSCDFSTVLSCTNIMKTDQASAFGFPNPLIGLIVFPIVVTVGVLLLARVPLPEWVWAGLQIGVSLGIAFVLWLQFQSLYRIGSLCPWCMVVWAVVVPTFLYVTRRNLMTWLPGSPVSRVLVDWHVLVLMLWYIAVVAAIMFRFYV